MHQTANIMEFADKMYEKCYSGLDLLAYIEPHQI